MTPGKKNKLTLDILKRLRDRGAPESKPISLDMTMEDEELEGESENGMPDMIPKKKKPKSSY